MINLWLRGCCRTKSSLFQSVICKPLVSTFDSHRCFCSEKIGKQLTKINKNKEIKGYFVEDFNVKGQAFWEVSTRLASGSIIYVISSALAAGGSVYIMSTPFALDLIERINLVDLISYFDLPDDLNPWKLFTITLYLFTEPIRIIVSYVFSNRIRNFLYKKKFFSDPKYKPFKGEKDYDEEKIGKF